MAQSRTLTAVDPATGARITRRTARTYVAAVVFTAADGSVHVHAWAGRPDLAAKQVAKLERLGIGGQPRLAPVVADPWAEPVAAEPTPTPVAEPAPVVAEAQEDLVLALAEPAATRPTLPGEALPPAPPAPHGAAAPALPELRAAATAGRPVSLAALSRTLGRELGLATGGRLSPRAAGGGLPWDPGTPEARERVALQGERVATLWPIARVIRGAGLTLPGAWASDGPVAAGAWPVARAVAALSPEAIRAACRGLAAPETVAEDRALAACLAALARV